MNADKKENPCLSAFIRGLIFCCAYKKDRQADFEQDFDSGLGCIVVKLAFG